MKVVGLVRSIRRTSFHARFSGRMNMGFSPNRTPTGLGNLSAVRFLVVVNHFARRPSEAGPRLAGRSSVLAGSARYPLNRTGSRLLVVSGALFAAGAGYASGPARTRPG